MLEIIKNILRRVLILIISFLCRIIVIPLYLFIPINDTKIVFVGSEKGFYGNSRHLFEHMNKTVIVKAQYYTNQKDVINKHGKLPMLKSYNIINLFRLLNTSVVVTDHGMPWYIGVFAYRA